MEKKTSYVKDTTRDLPKLKQIVRLDLKKRNNELIKVLVKNLNRNTI